MNHCWAVLNFYEELPVPALKTKLEQFWFQVQFFPQKQNPSSGSDLGSKNQPVPVQFWSHV
jgi:hypothetical protein